MTTGPFGFRLGGLDDKIAAEERFMMPLTDGVRRTEVQAWLCWSSLKRHKDTTEIPPGDFNEWRPLVVDVRAVQLPRKRKPDTPLPPVGG